MNIVPFEIAKKLKKLGYNRNAVYYYESNGEIQSSFSIDNEDKVTIDDILFDFNNDSWWGYGHNVISAPSVHEAIDFIREEKGIACGVHPFARHNQEGVFVCWDYTYTAYDGEKDLLNDVENWITLIHPTHTLASLALLKELITYLEEKK